MSQTYSKGFIDKCNEMGFSMDKLARVDFSRYQSSSRSSLEDLWQVLRDLTAQVDEVQTSVDKLERNEKKAFILGFIKQAVQQNNPALPAKPTEQWSKNIMKQAPTQQKAVGSALSNQTAQPAKPPAATAPASEFTPGIYPGQQTSKAQNITDLQQKAMPTPMTDNQQSGTAPQSNAPDMGLNI